MRLNVFLAMCAFMGLAPGCATAGSGAPAEADRDLIARLHFGGTARLASDPNAASLNAIVALPETAALTEQTLQKLAVAPYLYLQNHASGTNNFAPLIRPLLEDLLRAESCVEMRGPTNEVPELLLAVRLDKARADLWRKNLAEVLTNWTGIPVKDIQAEGFDGWELKKHHQPDCIRLFQADDWVLFGWGDGDIRAQAGMLRRIKEKQLPVEIAGNAWLDLQVFWSRLGSNPAKLGPFTVSSMHFTVEGRKDYVRPKLIMQFTEPLGLTLKPWQTPTGLIHNPIVAFTAVRGMLPRLNELPSVKELNANPLPDQFFIWATQQIPYETCVAAPMTNPTNYMDRIAPGLISFFNTKIPPAITSVKAEQTNRVFRIRGLPIMAPFLGAMHTPVGDYLVGGLLPSPRREEPFPPGLKDELAAEKNLVAYDWERTDVRMSQLRGVNQIIFLIYRGLMPKPDAPGQKWIDAAAAKLGNCGTRVTLTAPNELTLVRNSGVGLTSLEMYWLAYWLDSPGFPLGAYHETARWRPVPKKPYHE